MFMKNVAVSALLALAVSGLPAAAQEVHGVTVEGPHAKMTVTLEAPQAIGSNRVDDFGLVTIYDSIAGKYPKGRYWCCSGYNVMGQNQGTQWMGGAFTPGANHTATRIEIAVGWSQGPNGVVVSINSDNNGVPGTALKTWNVSNLPIFGTCCTLVVKTDKAGIPLTGGRQYWIVLSTNGNENDTVDAWNVSDADQIDNGNFASWSSGTWHTFQTAPGLAFAVKGSN